MQTESEQTLAAHFLSDARKRFAEYRTLAEKGMAQIDDRAFFHEPSTESNSIALIVKHMAGNLKSRWSDALTTDGEKPDRGRDNEFVIIESDSRESLMHRWSEGYQILDASLASFTSANLTQTLTIRGEKLVVTDAILRALAHSAGHCGQIVYLSKWLAGETWETLSIPRKRI